MKKEKKSGKENWIYIWQRKTRTTEYKQEKEFTGETYLIPSEAICF